jgi:squalene-hopene/tetraprenyl-beta-curcumene cyclase
VTDLNGQPRPRVKTRLARRLQQIRSIPFYPFHSFSCFSFVALYRSAVASVVRSKEFRSIAVKILSILFASVLAGSASAAGAQASWDAKAAAAYLDARQTWWSGWQTSARDHQTACVSCHTALPFALARPALRSELHEADASSAERRMVDDVIKRVRLWKDVEPFYPDQTRGLPKTSESRGTESVLNALVLATRDEHDGRASDDARLAFDNMWALQFRIGDMNGGWAWLNFHNEPWEANDSPYLGATLAAIAVGREPGGYASSEELTDRLKRLREYLRKGMATQPLLNRAMLLWASAGVPDLLAASERQAIVDALCDKQRADGGWSVASLGQYKRGDNTPLDTLSDGYATGLVTYALERAGLAANDQHVSRALGWLVQHQDHATGMWVSSSLNKQRDLKTDIGKFMSDAATAYAALALTAAIKR